MQKNIAKMSIGLSVSVRDRDGKLVKQVFDPIIYRGDFLPCTRNRTYRTTKQSQTAVNLRVYAGEQTFVEDNLELGNFVIEKIPKNDVGKEKVDVTFHLDKDLMLYISLKVKSTGREETRVIDTKIMQEDIRVFNKLYNR
ncbi:Hsp70 family protein [Tissierella creatinophila]|uniref:Chaperone protein DnaK n=1 Tax=Tissierella creatinophila DSM 6911 TaxID=1123403 RepID=A0A1U7M4M1_TISCR|nr:Hsp70 family protein [Tissierella creatinophila]OLS02264.1 chaperone protein DnaK [Tissierella creatinophila DSM 6911]